MMRTQGLRMAICALLTLPAGSNVGAQHDSKPFSITISLPSGTSLKSGSIVQLDITITNNSSQPLILRDNRLGPELAGIRMSDGAGVDILPREDFRLRPDTMTSGIGL